MNAHIRHYVTIERFKGNARDARPLSPISFIFMQFLRKIWLNNKLASPHLGLAPPWEILDPPLEVTFVVAYIQKWKIPKNVDCVSRSKTECQPNSWIDITRDLITLNGNFTPSLTKNM